jgi:hypothetical protein
MREISARARVVNHVETDGAHAKIVKKRAKRLEKEDLEARSIHHQKIVRYEAS